MGVSVNVSARQLQRPELIAEVEDALVASGIAPAALTLEITESGLMEEKDVAAAQLEDLRRLGVRVAVDDFGTGYSSLGYLSSLPIDILKIDKMFIDGVSQGPEDSAIAGAVGKLASALGLTLVAEGIESLDQVVALRGMEFQRGQGHFFSRALPAEEIAALLRKAHI
jgi:EAL domain-containing protein (putative c-di-GMP-specific phosphodiesterase class I)